MTAPDQAAADAGKDREKLARAFIRQSGKAIHASDCATSNAPELIPGPCDCDVPQGADAELVERLRAMKPEGDQHGIWEVLRNPDGPKAADRIEALSRQPSSEVTDAMWDAAWEASQDYFLQDAVTREGLRLALVAMIAAQGEGF